MQDDPDQSRRVQRCLIAAKDRDEPLFLNHIVLCECVWVLSYSYGFPKSALVDVLDRLLTTKQFVIEDKPAVWAAVADYRASQADFADCLIGVKNATQAVRPPSRWIRGPRSSPRSGGCNRDTSLSFYQRKQDRTHPLVALKAVACKPARVCYRVAQSGLARHADS